MKTKNLLIILLSLLTISLSSCKKEDDEPLSKSELLTKEIWNWDKMESYENNILVDSEDKTGYKMEFNDDHSLIIYNPDGSIDENLIWEINMDETNLFISTRITEEAMVFDIDKLTENIFIFSATWQDGGGKIKAFEDVVNSEKIVFYLSR